VIPRAAAYGGSGEATREIVRADAGAGGDHAKRMAPARYDARCEGGPGMQRRIGSMFAAAGVLAVATTLAHADDDVPAFDRPGLAFASATLPRASCAWEQGLFDADTDRAARVRTTDVVADSLLHCGVADGVELQLGADSWGRVDVRGPGVSTSASGGGDARIGVKVAPWNSEAFSLAVLATAGVPTGRAPIGGGGHPRDLGVSMAWPAGDDRSVTLYADRHWGPDGNGALVALAYGFPLRDRLAGYVEGGVGSGASHAREAGGGLSWMATPRVQFDASFLRALDRATTDWQAGIGVSILFAPAPS